jgi:hypothetical protein
MANIVSHLVSVTGSQEAVRRFRDRMVLGATLDFGALIPTPAVLRDADASSAASEGLILLGADHLPDPLMSTSTVREQAARMLDYPWVREAGVTDRAGLDALLKRRANGDGGVEKRLALGRKAIAAFEATGHVTAGSWAVEHWGCDGVRDFDVLRDEPGRLEFSLGTAWATPERVWDRIADTFPDVAVSVVGFEEAWHFAVTGEIAGGRNGVREVEPTAELYERVYGQPYVEEDAGEEDEPAGEAPAVAESLRRSAIARESSARVTKRLEAVNWDLVGWILAAFVALGYFAFWG